MYDNFKQKKLIAIKCAKLADIILNTPKIWDANMISLITNVSFFNTIYYEYKYAFYNLFIYLFLD